MTRHLTKKQENYLRVLLDSGLSDVDDMTMQQWNELESMNDFETLYQKATMFIWDHMLVAKGVTI